MRIYSYDRYNIFEGKGISDNVKKLSNSLLASLFKGKFQDFTFDINLPKLKSIDVLVVRNKMNYDSSFYSKSSSLSDIQMTLDIPLDPNPMYLHEILTHELTHLWEFYHILIFNQNMPMYSKLKKGLTMTINQDQIDILSELRYIIYLTLDNELNARVSQTYQYLLVLKNPNKDQLLNHIKKSSSWKKMEIISKFSHNDYFERLVSDLGLDLSIIMINNLNKEILDNGFNKSFIRPINDEVELRSYLKSWSKVFKYKMKKHKEKLIKVIDEVIKDIK